MILPIDTSTTTTLCGCTAEPVTDFASGAPKTDATSGAPMYSVPVILLAATGPEVISVKVAGHPAGLVVGQPVTVTGLTATTWAMGDRSGVAFRASSIEAAASARPGKAGNASTSPALS